MWILGVVALVVTSVLIGQLLARGANKVPAESLWDLPRTTSTYTSIVGMLAGFTVVITMFFANLTIARSSPEFESVIGMLLIAFLLFVAAAMEFGTTPNLADRTDEDYLLLQRTSYQLANLGYFAAIATSWLTLKLFLMAIGLPFLAKIFTWILLFAVFSGSVRMAQFCFRMTTLGRSACLIAPFLSFGLAAFYRLAVVRWVPALQAEMFEPFFMAICVFVVGAAGFAFQSSAIMAGDTPGIIAFLKRRADRLLLGYLQAISTIIALLWLAIALA